MKKTIKTILTSLAALAMLSTAPVQLNAYSMNEPKLVVQSEKRDLHINFSKDGKKFTYTRLKDNGGFSCTSEIVTNESGIEKVLTQGYVDMKPAFSPDGKKIAFFRLMTGGAGYVCVADADGKNLEDIAIGKITQVSWSPDGKEIAYTDERVEEKTHILTKEDIESLKNYYKTDKIAYKPGDEVKYRELHSAISLVDVKTKEVKQLTQEGECQDPEFTDDGRIVYVSNENSGTNVGREIWIMNSDGSNKQPLVQPENYEKKVQDSKTELTVYQKEGSASSVSIDGDWMAFMMDTRDHVVRIKLKSDMWNYDLQQLKDEYKSGIYVKNLKTGETKLVTDEGSLWFPEVSKGKVYFSRYDDEKTEHDIYSVDLE